MNKIELSLSPKYVSNWGLNEAVREILQNAIDSETAGYEVDVTYNRKRLTIKTIGTHLDKSTLLLGESGKNDDKFIGKYGEGYKLALLVLKRLGKNIIIRTNKEMWTPIFEHSDTFNEELLKIKVTPDLNEDKDIISFEISEIEQHELLSLSDEFIALDRFLGKDIGQSLDTDYGVLLIDDKYSGKFFVNGLFVQKDTEFKYGYDFKNEYVNLDRDRKAINYYDLKELTARVLVATGDVEILERGLKSSIVDLSDTTEVLNNITEEQSVNFKKNYFDKYELEEDTLVATDKIIEISGKEKARVENEVITKIIFKADGKEDELEEYKRKLKDKNDEESAINSFNASTYKKLYIWLKDNESNLSIEAISDFKEILNRSILKPHNFHLIEDKLDELVAEDKVKCKYCGEPNGSKDEDVLCDECRLIFGHSFYSEL